MYIYVHTIEASVHGLATGRQGILVKPKNATSRKEIVFVMFTASRTCNISPNSDTTLVFTNNSVCYKLRLGSLSFTETYNATSIEAEFFAICRCSISTMS